MSLRRAHFELWSERINGPFGAIQMRRAVSSAFGALTLYWTFIELFISLYRGKLYRDNYRYRIIAQPYYSLWQTTEIRENNCHDSQSTSARDSGALSIWSPSSIGVWSGRERNERCDRDPIFFSLSYAEMQRDKRRIDIPDSIADASLLPRPSQSAGSVHSARRYSWGAFWPLE